MRQARRAFGHHDPRNSSSNHPLQVEGRALYSLWTRNPSWTLAPRLLWPKQRYFRRPRNCRDRTLSRRVDQCFGRSKLCPPDELNPTIAAEDRLACWPVGSNYTRVNWKHHSQESWEKFPRLNSTVWALNSRNCRNLMLYKWVENWSNALVRDIMPSCSLCYNGTKGSKIGGGNLRKFDRSLLFHW